MPAFRLRGSRKQCLATRASEGHPGPAPPVTGQLPQSAVVDEDYESDLTELEDSDNEEANSSNQTTRRPPAKRAKIAVKQIFPESVAKIGRGTRNAARRVGSTRRNKKHTRPSLLLAMPLDILFEIFRYLSPPHLLSLARTSKAFRNTLMTRQAKSIWREARRQSPDGIPECPLDVAEPKWADLIFGVKKCQECGCLRKLSPCYLAFYRYVCPKCLSRNLFYEGNSSADIPNFDATILDFLPYLDYAIGAFRSKRIFWRADILSLAKTLDKYRLDVLLGEPGAQKALKEFKQYRIDCVEHYKTHKMDYQKWYENLELRRIAEAKARREARHNAIYSRLQGLGYNNKDLHQLRNYPHVLVDRKLTERVWRQIRPALERKLKMNERLRLQYEVLVERRKVLIDTLFAGIRKVHSLMIPRKELLFSSSHIHELSACRAIINAPIEDGLQDLTSPACLNAVNGLRQYVTFTTMKAIHTITLVVQATLESVAETPHVSGVTPTTVFNTTVQPQTLAIAIFKCTKDNTLLFGWRGIVSHTCPSSHNSSGHPTCIQLTTSPRGAILIGHLLRLRGLDVHRTTVDQLDRLDPRYVCLGCPAEPVNGVQCGRLALPWRECVTHCIMRGDAHFFSRYQLVDPESSETIRRLEGPDPSWSTKKWSCNHCDAHIRDPQTCATVVEHIKHNHEIADPREVINYFHTDPEKRETPERWGFAMAAAPSRPSAGVVAGSSASGELGDVGVVDDGANR
ncbi:hypothetical protein B0H21DRAFT_722633 [Amylocystis lapponica]|nr:hypothetical protein B0H21DRAFT_722633 [Amylocystis lapponica]